MTPTPTQKLYPEKPEQIEVPQDVIEAAQKVDKWFRDNGFYNYEFQGLCSRNYAISLRQIAVILSEHRDLC